MTRALRIGLLLAAAAALLRCGEPMQAPTDELQKYNLAVTALAATYDPASGKVRVTWVPPLQPVSFFKLYRTSTTGADGGPTNMQSVGAQSRIPGSFTEYLDIVGLENTVYFYQMRAVLVAGIDTTYGAGTMFLDTVFAEGPASDTVSSRVGSGISFSINGGDLFTRYDSVSLVLLDMTHLVDTIQFGDSLPPASTVPIADAGRNPVTTFALPLSQDTLFSFPWWLRKGPGTKRVYARISYRSGAVDTVRLDEIDIEPFRADIKLRNELRKPNETMREMDSTEPPRNGKRSFTVFSQYIDFGLSIMSDSSFDTAFEYWLVFPDTTGKLGDSAKSGRYELSATNDIVRSGYRHSNLWVHTVPRQGRLTGIGAGHSDLHIYRYSFCPDTAAGDSNLARLYREVGDSAPATVVSGNTSAQNYELVTRLLGNWPVSFGKKEFSVLAHMKGRYFGEDRLVPSSGRLSRSALSLGYYDAYPPLCKRDYWVFYYPDDGSTINGAFSVDLNTDHTYLENGVQPVQRGLVWDMGGADVAAVDLVLTAMSDSMAAAWSYSTSPRTITLDMLYSRPHHVLSFPVATRDPRLCPVYWGIDPTGWNTGWYLVAVVTEDSFGNRGIAPWVGGTGQGFGAGRAANPQHWQLITGTVGP